MTRSDRARISDLLARIEGLTVVLPSLRERAEDVPFLLTKLLEVHGRGVSPPRLDPLLVEKLCLYTWPFNVRELAQFVRRVVALYPEADVLDATVFASLSETSSGSASNGQADDAGSLRAAPSASDEEPDVLLTMGAVRPADDSPPPYESALTLPTPTDLSPDELAERVQIMRTLAESIGSQTETAKKLGVSRSTLIKRMRRFRIPRPRARL